MAKNRNTTPPNPESWRTTVDGWVRDPDIRRHALLALAMLLVATALIVGLATGALAAAMNNLLPSLLTKAVASVTLTAAGGTSWWIRRHHARRALSAGVLPVPPLTPPATTGSSDNKTSPAT